MRRPISGEVKASGVLAALGEVDMHGEVKTRKIALPTQNWWPALSGRGWLSYCACIEGNCTEKFAFRINRRTCQMSTVHMQGT